MAAAANALRRNVSSFLGRNMIVVAAAKGAHTVFSLVSSATKSNVRQRKSRRATAAKKAPATKIVARGSIANARPRSQQLSTGGESKTSAAASNDSPVRSFNVV